MCSGYPYWPGVIVKLLPQQMLACVAFYDGKGDVAEAHWFKTDDAAMQDYAANRHKCALIPTAFMLYYFCFDSSITPPRPHVCHLTNVALRMMNLPPGEKRSEIAADFAAAVRCKFRCNPCLMRRDKV